MRRRGPGIAGLRKREEERSRYRSVGADLSATKLAQMEQQLSVFRSSLESFALKHRDQVRRDPYFRAQFHAMCAKVGVDPLASNKGAWAEALGLGYSDFFFELAVAVAEAGLQLRERQWGGGGGLVALDALVARKLRTRAGAPLLLPGHAEEMMPTRVAAPPRWFPVERVGGARDILEGAGPE